MILPEFNLKSRANSYLEFNGMDSPGLAEDKSHFKAYPHKVNYVFNSRGFRDKEWPADLAKSIWCFGDSFTVGLGSPVEHTWPFLLEKTIKKKCINVSMDGASNEWISRKVIQLIKEVQPEVIVIHWSFIWRTESKDSSLSDEDRRQQFAPEENFSSMVKRFVFLVNSVNFAKGNTVVIHSTIPGFSDYTIGGLEHIWKVAKGPSWPSDPITNLKEYTQLPQFVRDELKTLFNLTIENFLLFEQEFESLCRNGHWIKPFRKFDLARDGFHYDILTASKFASQISDLI